MSVQADAQIVPLADPRAENRRLRREIDAAIERVLDGGSYILGADVAGFEAMLARSVGAHGAVGVASGTDALSIALLAAGVTVGDEVIAPSHTAGPTVAAIRMVGAVPVLVEVCADDYCLDPAAVEAALGERTRAIIPVHLYGHPADLDRIAALARPRGIAVIEDCAQAQGARLGTRTVGGIGDLGCFSFYPTKNLGAIGDGGAITAATPALVERAQAIRTYGWTRPQFAEIAHGRCSRLDELQAAILAAKMRHLETGNERRRAIARRYAEALADLPLTLPAERAGCRHVYHLYVVRSARWDALADALAQRGVRTGRHYPFAVHQQPALVADARICGSLAGTERLITEILSLPMYPDMTEAQVEQVVTAVESFHRHG